MAKPTFVLVHGAHHGPMHFNDLSTALEACGYKVVAPSLPSVANSYISPSKDGLEDANTVRQTVLSELATADVIVVPHSYGGIPTASALQGLDTASRNAKGYRHSVVAIAAIASFILPKGMTITDALQRPAFNLTELPAIINPRPPEDDYFHDAPVDVRQKLRATLKPMSLAALADQCRFSAHEVIPVHYLMCEHDKALPIGVQQRILRILGTTATGKIRTEMIEGGHAPFVNRIPETVAFLRRSAGEIV